jgi:DNA (cytosine-5)-methyltransferase 1
MKTIRLGGLYDTEYSKNGAGEIFDINGSSPTLNTCNGGNRQPFIKLGDYMKNLQIRKLTPRECFRLMGVKDEDFDKVKKHQSNSSLYHLAGDSIVVQVLMAIFGEMI